MNLRYPCYWCRQDANGEWRWSYYAANSEEIAVGTQGYVTKTECRDAITLMQTSAHVRVFEGA